MSKILIKELIFFKKMDRQELINKIELVFSQPYINTRQVEKIRTLLPEMSNENLEIILENLGEKESSLFEADSLIYELFKNLEASIDFDAEIEKEASAHPLQDLTIENLAKVLNEELLFWLNKGVNVTKEVEIYLSFDNDLYPEEMRNKFLDALITNEEIVGKDNLVLIGGSNLKPTLSNWLKDYNTWMEGKTDLILARVDYLTRSLNISRLSMSEKENIKKIIELHDFLKMPVVSGPIADVVMAEVEKSREPVIFQTQKESIITVPRISSIKPTEKPETKKSVNPEVLAQKDQELEPNSFEEKYFEDFDEQNSESSK